MAELDGLGELDRMQYSGDEESTADDVSTGDSEEWCFDPQTIFKNMLQVARRLSHKDRQQQLVLLSLAMSAIIQADSDSPSDAETEKRSREGAQVKNTARKETRKENPGSFSSARKWSLEDHALVKKLRAETLSWDDISQHHFPGQSGKRIGARYQYWIKKSMDTAEDGNQEDNEPDGVVARESEPGLSDQSMYEW